jgi:transposase
MQPRPDQIVVGVDTHSETHTAVVVDGLGRVQGTLEVPSTPAGYRRLVRWARRHGELAAAGVEGTGAYGAGLTRHLVAVGIEVTEVDRPNRQRRRRYGKSDPTDAEAVSDHGNSRLGITRIRVG